MTQTVLLVHVNIANPTDLLVTSSFHTLLVQRSWLFSAVNRTIDEAPLQAAASSAWRDTSWKCSFDSDWILRTLSPSNESSKDLNLQESIWFYYTTMDSIVHVSNVTGLVIAMEVPVEQSVHCRWDHSDANLSRLCVGMLTANRSLEAHITRVIQLPRPRVMCMCALVGQIPVKITGYTIQRDQLTQARPRRGVISVLVHSLIGFRNLCQIFREDKEKIVDQHYK